MMFLLQIWFRVRIMVVMACQMVFSVPSLWRLKYELKICSTAAEVQSWVQISSIWEWWIWHWGSATLRAILIKAHQQPLEKLLPGWLAGASGHKNPKLVVRHGIGSSSAGGKSIKTQTLLRGNIFRQKCRSGIWKQSIIRQDCKHDHHKDEMIEEEDDAWQNKNSWLPSKQIFIEIL